MGDAKDDSAKGWRPEIEEHRLRESLARRGRVVGKLSLPLLY